MPKKPKPAKKAGTAVAVHKAPPPPATYFEFLDRSARDPNFSAEKFQIIVAEKRLENDERRLENDRAKEDAFDEAMHKVQEALAPIRADMENKQTKSRYASDVALDNAIRPIYSRYGFALSFGTADGGPPDHVRVTCRVSCAGHRRTPHIDIPVVTTGPKGTEMMTKVHATGSAVTYGNRYLILSIFNLKVIKKVGEPFADDDGNAAGATMAVVTDKQADTIRDLILETKSDIEKFLKYFKVESVADMPAAHYQRAIDSLNAKKKKAQAA